MKKIFTLAACAALCTGYMWADIKIGETTYETLQAAVDAAAETDVITVSGEYTQSGRLNINKPVTITGTDNAVIKATDKKNIVILVPNNSQGVLKMSNITIDGGDQTWENRNLMEINTAGNELTNVTFKNAGTTHNGGLMRSINKGRVTLENVTVENCTVNEGRGEFFCGTNDAITVKGDNNFKSIYIEKQLRIKAENPTNATPITIYLENRTSGNVVMGCTDLSKFTFVGCAEGYSVDVSGDNLAVQQDVFVAKVNGQGVKSWDAAWTAGVADTEETIEVELLTDLDIAARYINSNKNSNVAFTGAGEGITLTNTNGNKGQTMFEANSGTTAFKNIKFVSEDERTQNGITAQAALVFDHCDMAFYSTAQNQLYIKDNGKVTATATALPKVSVAKKGSLTLGAGCEIETINIEINEAGVYPCIFVGDAFNAVALTFGDVTDMTAVLGKTLISGTTDATKFTLPESLEYELVANEANDGLMFSDNQSGVESVMVEDADAPVEWFNLQGVRVANPDNGVYIRRQGNKVEKVVL